MNCPNCQRHLTESLCQHCRYNDEDLETPEDMVLCNCVDCKAILRSRNQHRDPKINRRLLHLPGPPLAHKIMGRPYCASCINVRATPLGGRASKDDMSPMQENYIRIMEDG